MNKKQVPVIKKIRKFEHLPGLTCKNYILRKYYPGQTQELIIPNSETHLQNKNSTYQLAQKQKLCLHYNIKSSQLKLYFKKFGKNIFNKLEMRLDSIVFRLTWAKTIKSAKQLICHQHILVNKKVITSPGLQIKPGDVINIVASLSHKKKIWSNVLMDNSLINTNTHFPSFLKYDALTSTGFVLNSFSLRHNLLFINYLKALEYLYKYI